MGKAYSGQILFHGPDDLPYGSFSAFACTPVWIAGRRYATVEHWYQAMRGVGDEHEWIRGAASPQDAKIRAAEIEPRSYWTEEKVFIMYRGMLAKCRQHPTLTHLLLATGDAEIHEDSTDRFWGFQGGRGEDWLGKILCGVRASLQSLDLDEPLAGLLRGRFLNYETAVAVRNIRSGGQSWLVHLIRYRETLSPIDALRQIIEGGVLRASRQLNGHYSVCFSATPLHDLELRVFGNESHLRSSGGAHVYSPFGVAITYDFARELGLRPVLPVPTEVTPFLPEYLRFLCQPYSAADLLDYTHEDEWRAPFDVDIREGPFALVVPNGRTLCLTSTYDSTRDELLQVLEARSDRPSPHHSPAPSPIKPVGR